MIKYLCQEIGKLKQETVDVINVLTGSVIDTSEVDEEGSVNVCKAIDSMMQRAKMEEKMETALTLKKMGMDDAVIAEAVRTNLSQVQQWLSAAAM